MFCLGLAPGSCNLIFSKMISGVFLESVEFQEFVVFQPHCYMILVAIVAWVLEEEVFHYTRKKKGHFFPCHKGMFGKIHWEFVYD